MKIIIIYKRLRLFVLILLFAGCSHHYEYGPNNIESLEMQKIRHDVEVKLTDISYYKSSKIANISFEVNNKRDTNVIVYVTYFCGDIIKVLNEGKEKFLSEYEAVYIDTFPLHPIKNEYYQNGEIMFRHKDDIPTNCRWGDMRIGGGVGGANTRFTKKTITSSWSDIQLTDNEANKK